MVLGAVLLAAGCGAGDPDNVDSADVVRRISPRVISIHARRLPDEDIGSLIILTNLQNLDFMRGFAAFPAKITDAGLALRIPTKSDTDSENNRTPVPIQIGQLSERSDALVLDIKNCPN